MLGERSILEIGILRAEGLPQMDAVGISDRDGCDPYVVLRYDGTERFRSKTIYETYHPVRFDDR